ncbi:hypothetical protein [Novosphingobium resinovorum]|uniref:Uncharacterized protein n=1 Tax=Novosphingobium resinovorum TaxID=158500 RepID=A0A1D8AGD8_9SPHN|nr:hypothetical protein [Novosphingobium resinovorum]AOR81175.1 hypothetical protein BES08_30340 [Novosphingobium resinovorum]
MEVIGQFGHADLDAGAAMLMVRVSSPTPRFLAHEHVLDVEHIGSFRIVSGEVLRIGRLSGFLYWLLLVNMPAARKASSFFER